MNASLWPARNLAGAVRRIVPLLPLMLTACQTSHPQPPAMSLEEALAVTASFQPVKFSPPPRTAEDITALLEYNQLSDDRRAQMRALFASGETSGADKVKLAAIYHDKANAAMLLGNSPEWLSNLQRTVGLTEGTIMQGHYEPWIRSSLAALLLSVTLVDAQSERRCEVSSIEISAAKRLPQVVGDLGVMVRGLQSVRIETPDKAQACALQKRIDGMRAEEIKNYEGLSDDCVIDNMKVSEIKRRINSPPIHREEACD
jgi:hypothetical protein